MDTEDTDFTVVGGRAEPGYESAGYLLQGPSASALGLACGATLIAPDLAVTAAHCVLSNQRSPVRLASSVYGVGFGSSPSLETQRVLASHVLPHPEYDYDLGSATRFTGESQDIAILRLAQPVTGITPAVRSRASGGTCRWRYVGYGRTTPGDFSVTSGFTDQRRSAGQCTEQVSLQTIETNGTDGGLCWGDSGGPLFEHGTNRIVGVLADFNRVFDCQVGNRMRFASLDGHSDFIDCAARRLGVAGSQQAPFPDVMCHWAENWLATLASRRAIGGYPDGTFRPYATMTRAEFAAIIAAAIAPRPVRESVRFRDVPSGAWYARAVDIAQRGGYMSGDPGGMFRPGATITRAEMIVALASGLRLPLLGATDNVNTFSVLQDSSTIPQWARPQVAAAIRARLVTAYPDTSRIEGGRAARRAEVAATVHQALVQLGRVGAVENEFLVR